MATAHETEGGPRAPAEEASVPLNHSWLEELYVALVVWAGVFVYLGIGLQCLIWRREAAIIVILP